MDIEVVISKELSFNGELGKFYSPQLAMYDANVLDNVTQYSNGRGLRPPMDDLLPSWLAGARENVACADGSREPG
jgi:hypothetical protein